jgi:tetratricopeptide (TPR) repeat protein
MARFLLQEGKDDEADIISAAATAHDAEMVRSFDAMRSQFHNEKAWDLLLATKPAEGLADAERAVALAPDDASIIDTRGQIYAALGRFEAAVADLDKAIAGGASMASTFAVRGRAHEALGNRDAAIADYRKALAQEAGDEHERWAHTLASERLIELGVSAETPGSK